MEGAPPNSDDLISQFVSLVQVSPQVVSYSISFFPILYSLKLLLMRLFTGKRIPRQQLVEPRLSSH